MKKHDFFLRAMLAHEYKRTAWVISAFSVISEEPEDWKKDPYPYRIVQTAAGYFFVNPDNTSELTIIDDAIIGKPLFYAREKVSLSAGDVENLFEDITTTYGNVLFNYIAVVYPFGNKIPFQTGRISPGKMESLIIDRLKDNLKPDDPVPKSTPVNQPIYVSEYLKFSDAMFCLSAYTQLFVPSYTEKAITAPPGVKELRTRLLEENKDRLHDPAVIAKIDSQLVQYLKDWMKDDPAMGFLIKDKSFSNVRKKLYLMIGAEYGMDDARPEVELVETSLSEGWKAEKFAALNTSSRSGSFSRSSMTELGGEATKWLMRASSNITITMDDCKSSVGIEVLVNKGEESKLIGFTAVRAIENTDGESEQEKITADNVGSYLGHKVYIRSPMYCLAPKTDFCRTCVGDRLSISPTGLSTAISEYGSVFLTTMMKAMHSTALVLRRMDKDSIFF
jgi:hypothetical protein